MILLRGGRAVRREAHRKTVTFRSNAEWKNSRNCWKILIAIPATAWQEIASAMAQKWDGLDNQQPNLVIDEKGSETRHWAL